MSLKSSVLKLVLRLQYNISFPFDRLYELRDLIRFVEEHVVDCQRAHVAAAERQIGKPIRVRGRMSWADA